MSGAGSDTQVPQLPPLSPLGRWDGSQAPHEEGAPEAGTEAARTFCAFHVPVGVASPQEGGLGEEPRQGPALPPRFPFWAFLGGSGSFPHPGPRPWWLDLAFSLPVGAFHAAHSVQIPHPGRPSPALSAAVSGPPRAWARPGSPRSLWCPSVPPRLARRLRFHVSFFLSPAAMLSPGPSPLSLLSHLLRTAAHIWGCFPGPSPCRRHC